MPPDPARTRGYSPFLPLAIGLLGFLIFVISHASQLYLEGRDLKAKLKRQDASYQQSQRVREQMRGIAAGLRSLAEVGNANALAVVERLRQQGIDIQGLE
jgi:hypothetical protein